MKANNLKIHYSK